MPFTFSYFNGKYNTIREIKTRLKTKRTVSLMISEKKEQVYFYWSTVTEKFIIIKFVCVWFEWWYVVFFVVVFVYCGSLTLTPASRAN